MDENKHYIRLDSNNNVIKGFSDAFEQPLSGDVCINEKGERHFELFGQVNPPLQSPNGVFLYYYTGDTIVVKPQEEIVAEISTPTIEERISALESAQLGLMLGGVRNVL